MKDMTVEELEQGMKLVINSDAVDLIGKMAITNTWNELLRRFEDTKCCGNCELGYTLKCPMWKVYKEVGEDYPIECGYCSSWQSDGLSRAEREEV